MNAVIERIAFCATADGRFPELVVAYQTVDGTRIERLSFAPKALFRMKRWFGLFGLAGVTELDLDDRTDDLIEPNLVGRCVNVEADDALAVLIEVAHMPPDGVSGGTGRAAGDWAARRRPTRSG